VLGQATPRGRAALDHSNASSRARGTVSIVPSREFRPNEVSAGGVVICRHAADVDVCLVNDGRYWGLPKGNVERGEAPVDAALREIHEEVGLEPATLRVIGEVKPSDYVYRRQGRLIFKRVHIFVVESVTDANLHADGHEITEARWFPLAEARAVASFADTTRAIDEAASVVAGPSAAAP
jgi:8-oxo-dGTP pyrophosphatase MutT (NUDIX family)